MWGNGLRQLCLFPGSPCSAWGDKRACASYFCTFTQNGLKARDACTDPLLFKLYKFWERASVDGKMMWFSPVVQTSKPGGEAYVCIISDVSQLLARNARFPPCQAGFHLLPFGSGWGTNYIESVIEKDPVVSQTPPLGHFWHFHESLAHTGRDLTTMAETRTEVGALKPGILNSSCFPEIWFSVDLTKHVALCLVNRWVWLVRSFRMYLLAKGSLEDTVGTV